MYNLEYLPIAYRDMVDSVRYISKDLGNPSAAEQLIAKMEDAENRILQFPYANPIYPPIRPLKHEYRKLLVQNYFVLYWVDEAEKRITVARVLYARRSPDHFLE